MFKTASGGSVYCKTLLVREAGEADRRSSVSCPVHGEKQDRAGSQLPGKASPKAVPPRNNFTARVDQPSSQSPGSCLW